MKAIQGSTHGSMSEVEGRLRTALSDHGFGVLTEIDVSAVLKEKLGVERALLKILGACNPTFASQALDIDPQVALLLPCNVTLEATGDDVTISAADPRELLTDPGLVSLANDAAALLAAAIASATTPTGRQ